MGAAPAAVSPTWPVGLERLARLAAVRPFFHHQQPRLPLRRLQRDSNRGSCVVPIFYRVLLLLLSLSHTSYLEIPTAERKKTLAIELLRARFSRLCFR